MVVFTVALGLLITLIKVDTDPENMLSQDEPVRSFHNQTKERFSLYDIVVVGIVNDKDPNGVFNPSSLAKIHLLTEFAKTLKWPDEKDPNRQVGVVEFDLLAPSTVDHIGQGGPGEVRFEWLMRKPPLTDADALQIKNKALSNPLLKGTIVSEDGKAVCLYLPLTSKDLSYRVYSRLREKTAEFKGDEEYHITGLPVAEDTFGVEMFIQMAISAPLAMLTIFILNWFFFRKLILIIPPMIVAMATVICTMGLLIGFGFPVHIMSSMIPIFLMPISVVDSVHILSEFFDRYTKTRGRQQTIIEVMGRLFTAMLYTSLTSAAGFVSLALTPIPPVQVFGVFVAVGVMIAWVFTVTFVPAYVMLINEKSLENFGHEAHHGEKETRLMKLLGRSGRFTYDYSKLILVIMLIVAAVAVYGISRIRINDNPVKWFAKRHPIRRADIELNKHFGGTYMAYLVLDSSEPSSIDTGYIHALRNRLLEKAAALRLDFPNALDVVGELETLLFANASKDKTKEQLLSNLADFADQKAALPDASDIWPEMRDFFEQENEGLKIFKQPVMLEYIAELQRRLEQSGLVGKTSSVADVVRKVYQELVDGRAESYKIPATSAAVEQCLLQFESSHNPDDLWHLVTYDYLHANIWLQLKSGDNRDMQKAVKAVDEFFDNNPSPSPIDHNWAGLTYINVVWQEKMVWGMLQSFLGSFLIVFVMMVILFRSVLWGLVCMIPLTLTITAIYGLIGLVGKDYDMPVAVLSALTLGMAVDFAIHFLERSRLDHVPGKSWQELSPQMFGEPALAISRNVLVIAIGFLPLLFAPLVPYKTVGIFVCAIMAVSGGVTLVVLPAIIAVSEKQFFKTLANPVSPACNCALCVVVSVSTVVLVALNVHQFAVVGWSTLTWSSIIAVPFMALACGIISRSRQSRKLQAMNKDTNDNRR